MGKKFIITDSNDHQVLLTFDPDTMPRWLSHKAKKLELVSSMDEDYEALLERQRSSKILATWHEFYSYDGSGVAGRTLVSIESSEGFSLVRDPDEIDAIVEFVVPGVIRKRRIVQETVDPLRAIL